MRKLLLLMLLAGVSISSAEAQKVRFGYDKSVDFSQYRTYSYPPQDPSAAPDIRREALIGEIDHVLKTKGLTRVESGGDLILSGNAGAGGEAGGMGAAALAPSPSNLYTADSTMWTGSSPAPGAMVIEGALELRFSDPKLKKIVWSGVTVQKLDPGGLSKNLERIQKAIEKLLEKYPPK